MISSSVHGFAATNNVVAHRMELLGSMTVIAVVFAVAWINTSTMLAFCSAAIVVCSIYLIRKSTAVFDLRRISILNFWYLTYFAMILVPSFMVFSDHEGPFRGRYLFAVESVLLTVPIGAAFVSIVLGFRVDETHRYFELEISEHAGVERLRRRAAILLAVVLLVTFEYFREVKTVPLFYMLTNPGEHAALALLRDEAFKLLDSPLSYVYFIARTVLYPFLIALFLGLWLKSRDKRWLWSLVMAGAAGLLFAGAAGAKSPVAAIFLIVALFMYLFHGGRLTRKAVTVFLALIWLFPAGVVYLSYLSPDITTADVGRALGQRAFYMPAEVVYYYFEVFPANTPYLHGRSIDKFARLFDMHPFDTANYVGLYAYPQYHLDSISANGAFIADLNADFGLTGVLVGGLLAGGIMQFLHIHFIRKPKTIANLACYAYLILAFWDLHSTSLPIVLASGGALLILLLAALFRQHRTGASTPEKTKRSMLSTTPGV
jgi:oligosaccharide repeat unit polymerase